VACAADNCGSTRLEDGVITGITGANALNRISAHRQGVVEMTDGAVNHLPGRGPAGSALLDARHEIAGRLASGRWRPGFGRLPDAPLQFIKMGWSRRFPNCTGRRTWSATTTCARIHRDQRDPTYGATTIYG
jgi:hypothetical protein